MCGPSNTGRENKRGRGNIPSRKASKHSTGKSDPCSIHIAPLEIFENQVIPIGLHNISKIILTKSSHYKNFIYAKQQKNGTAFKHFEDFSTRLKKNVYFMKSFLGVIEAYKNENIFQNFLS